MKKLILLLLSLFAASALPGPELRVARAAEAKRAPDNCRAAHAILGWSDFKKVKGKHGKDENGHWIDETDEEFEERTKKPWVKVGWVVGRLNWGRSEGNQVVDMVDRYKPGVYNSVAFEEYRVKGNDNAKAYVAHCGSGAMCNLIAERFYNLYKGIGSPKVVCGQNAVPKVVHGGAKPSVPIPSDEELAEDLEGDEFDFGDDDDDDDDDSADDF